MLWCFMILSVALKSRTSFIYLCIYRRRSRSPSPRHRRRRSRSPTSRRHRSRSLTPRRHKRQKSKSPSLSPKAKSPSIGSLENKIVDEKLKKEQEDEKKRYFVYQIHVFIIAFPRFYSSFSYAVDFHGCCTIIVIHMYNLYANLSFLLQNK